MCCRTSPIWSGARLLGRQLRTAFRRMTATLPLRPGTHCWRRRSTPSFRTWQVGSVVIWCGLAVGWQGLSGVSACLQPSCRVCQPQQEGCATGLERSTNYQTWAGRLLLSVVLQTLAWDWCLGANGEETNQSALRGSNWLWGLDAAEQPNSQGAIMQAWSLHLSGYLPSKGLHASDAVKGWFLLQGGKMTCAGQGWT